MKENLNNNLVESPSDVVENFNIPQANHVYITENKSVPEWMRDDDPYIRQYVLGYDNIGVSGKTRTIDNARNRYARLGNYLTRNLSDSEIARLDNKYNIDQHIFSLAHEDVENSLSDLRTRLENGEISDRKFDKQERTYLRKLDNLNKNQLSLDQKQHPLNYTTVHTNQDHLIPLVTVGLPLGIIGGVKAAPYLWKVLQNPLVQAWGTYEGIKNLTSENGVQKTINHFKNDEYGKGALSLTGDVLDALPIGAATFSGIRGINTFKNGQRGWNLFNTAFSNTDTMRAIKYVNDMKNKAQFYGFIPNISLSIPKNQLNSGLPLNWIDGIFNRTRYNEAKALTNYANINGININVADPKWRYKRIGSIPAQLEDARLRIGSLRGTTLLPSSQSDIQVNTFFGDHFLSDYEKLLNNLYNNLEHLPNSNWVNSNIPGVRINLADKTPEFFNAHGIKVSDPATEWLRRGYDPLDPNRPLNESMKQFERNRLEKEADRLLKIERKAKKEYESWLDDQAMDKIGQKLSEDFQSSYLQKMIRENPRYYMPMKDLMNSGLSEEEAWRQLIIDRNTLYRAFGIVGESVDDVTNPKIIDQYARQLTDNSVNKYNSAMVGYQRMEDNPQIGGIFTGNVYADYGYPNFTLRRYYNQSDNQDFGRHVVFANALPNYHNRVFVKMQPKLDFSGPMETWYTKNRPLSRGTNSTPTNEFTYNTNHRYKTLYFPESYKSAFKGDLPSTIQFLPEYDKYWRDRLAREIIIEGPKGEFIPFNIVDSRNIISRKTVNNGMVPIEQNPYTDYQLKGFLSPSVSYGYKHGGKIKQIISQKFGN